MELLVITEKHSYLIDEKNLMAVELGSIIFKPKENKLYTVSAPGTLMELGIEVLSVKTLKELEKALAAGGNIKIAADIDAPTAFIIAADTTIVNNEAISISEDPNGDGVFKAVEGTLILDGKGTINGVGKNDYNMAVWAAENGKVIIKDGFFTNEGAAGTEDPTHYDLIYASGNGQIEILGGEFKCETPAWILNVKDKDRATASIVVKGGKFHGFNPADCASEGPNTNFVAPGYKVVEENGVFTVMPE